MILFKPQVDNIKAGQTTRGFTVINPMFMCSIAIRVRTIISGDWNLKVSLDSETHYRGLTYIVYFPKLVWEEKSFSKPKAKQLTIILPTKSY